MKRRIASGNLKELVPAHALSGHFSGAIESVSAHVDGEIRYFEAGVYCGQSMALWFEVCREHGVETRAYGADSFQGLPSQVEDDEGNWLAGMFWCPRKVAAWNMQRLGVPMERVKLIEGWFEESLTPTLAREIDRIDVAMLDADAYSSTVPVLSFLTPLLNSPSVIVFDDWYSGGNLDPSTGKSRGQGVERAFEEWLASNPSWEATPAGDYELANRHGRKRLVGRVFYLHQHD